MYTHKGNCSTVRSPSDTPISHYKKMQPFLTAFFVIIVFAPTPYIYKV